MPVAETLFCIATFFGQTIISGIVGNLIAPYVRFHKMGSSDKTTPNTSGLSPKDVNQLHLRRLFRLLDQELSDQVAVSVCKKVGITVKDFALHADLGTRKGVSKGHLFFKPLSKSRIGRYAFDMHDKTTKLLVQEGKKLWFDDKPPNEQTAYDCCTIIEAHFTGMKWKKGKYSCTLAKLSGWKTSGMFSNGRLDPEILRGKYRPSSSVDDDEGWNGAFSYCWDRVGDGQAHIGFTMCHETTPAKDTLQRRELMAIVGVMLTRMKSPYFEEHHVIPVILVSCFNECKARILQAHLRETHLVIYKSRLYDFSNPKNREESLPLFLAYMSSESVGTTNFNRS
ncbi:hypothetical protein BJY01DRAFT_250542 [Aspergillus pseudoustus]|uniref:Uncharacterized protein n=1 Tax=Aspergillus pseudoustus TaxID=1810923 RepID=A0ABR4JH43_9EURO